MRRSLAQSSPAAFGGYDLLEKVATGGMAEVYRARARRPGGVSKIVCLKRIHPTLCADPSFVDMFVEEARLGLTLSHGNIVPVFDFGCIDGYHFLVMEFVEGHDLADVVARSQIVARPFPADLAAFVVTQLLEGLAYAHGRRDEEQRPLELVHRDISPSNVMISSAGEVKILDFGIARSSLREFHTRTGVVKGKPGYMAPEQARGDALDARVDLFACGVILHELLTGARPQAQDGDDRLECAVEDEELGAITARALEPEPDDRFASAAEMRDALDQILIRRALRPGPSALAEYVGSLFEAPASVPDWSHQLDSVDRLLAAMVPERWAERAETTEELRPTRGPATEPMIGSPPTEPMIGSPATEPEIRGPVTETLASSPPAEPAVRSPAVEPGPGGAIPSPGPTVVAGRRREPRRGRAALVALLAAAALAAAAALLWPGAGPPRARSDAAVRPEPAPGPARIEIRTTPAGATIVLDGVADGATTPSVLEASAGPHRLELRLAGHVTQSREVEARAGQQLLLDTVLVPEPWALRITSEPAGAQVAVDGSARGRTPLELGGLERASRYRVELRLARYQPWSREVEFQGEEVTAVAARLEPLGSGAAGAGFLSVVARPWAEVLLDGQSVGETPIIRLRARAGRHTLVLRNPARGAEVRRSVVVPDGDEVRVSVDLAQASP